ncbi:MAG: DUF5011 domain-containing protein [Candidatus Izemoplasmatales bacterium]|nr:DUF5011 domain-containing protein [Candidatus Izemoplasmatales bacterium]MDD5292996.1 DUF5011 domain-containing protein [Candidatus Izemoplasmatales bacterium]
MKSKWYALGIIILIGMFMGCRYEPDEITLTLKPGSDTVEVHSSYSDPGAIAKARNWPIGYTVVSNTVNITEVGVYEIVYQAEKQGIVKQLTRIVTVIDETPPIIELLPGIDTFYEGDVWEDASVNVTDNSLKDVTWVVEGRVSTTVVGEYVIRYIAEDASGNVSEAIRYVNVLKRP